MTRILLLAVLAVGLTACAVEGRPILGALPDSTCGESTKGRTDAVIKYGTVNRFFLSIRLRYDVLADTEFRVKLRPKPGSESAAVKTIGKSGKLPDNTNTPFGWLDGEGSGKSTIVLCVPKGVPKGTEYKFDVEVGGIGRLDPRVRVN